MPGHVPGQRASSCNEVLKFFPPEMQVYFFFPDFLATPDEVEVASGAAFRMQVS